MRFAGYCAAETILSIQLVFCPLFQLYLRII